MIQITPLIITGVSSQLPLSIAGLGLVFLLYFSKKDLWLLLSAAFLVVFQALIFNSWDDMKYGTVASTILLVAIILALQRRRFGARVRSEVLEMFDSDLNKGQIITADNLQHLPPIVQKWMVRSNVVGKPPVQTLCIKQNGLMRTKPNGKWLPFHAEQFINVNNPGFVWTASVNSGFLIPINARDKYLHGHGNMLIKGLYTIPIANSSAPEIDQGTLMRFLAEIIWFPTAAFAKYIRWEYLSETTARATIENGGISVSGVFSFNSNGDVKGFEGMRYREINHHYELEKWIITIKRNRIFGGFRISDKCEVAWQGGSESFKWLEIELSKMRFNYGRQSAHSTEENSADIPQQNLELK